MEVHDVILETHDIRMSGMKCFEDGCTRRINKVIHFHGDHSIMDTVFQNKALFSHSQIYIGFCFDHRDEMSLLGYMMAIHQYIDVNMIAEINALSHLGRSDLSMLYESLALLNNHVTRKLESALSRDEICVSVKDFLRYFIDSQSTLLENYTECTQKLDDGFVNQHVSQALTLYFAIRRKFAHIHFPLSHSEFMAEVIMDGINFHDTIYHSTIYEMLVQ